MQAKKRRLPNLVLNEKGEVTHICPGFEALLGQHAVGSALTALSHCADATQIVDALAGYGEFTASAVLLIDGQSFLCEVHPVAGTSNEWHGVFLFASTDRTGRPQPEVAAIDSVARKATAVDGYGRVQREKFAVLESDNFVEGSKYETAVDEEYDRRVAPVVAFLEGVSAGSRRSLEHSLEVAARTLTAGTASADELPWAKIEWAHMQALRSRLAAGEYSPATVNKILSAVRGVLRAAWLLGQMTAEQYRRAAAVRGVKGTRLPAGRRIFDNDVSRLLIVCASDANKAAGARDSAILAMLYGSGLRREEAAKLTMNQYDSERGEITVIGKGDKERRTYLGADCRALVQTWLWMRGTEPGPVFCPVTKAGTILMRHMTGQAVYNMTRKRALEANIERFSPHDLRRSCISVMLDASVDLSTVQKMAGHASPATTARYDRRGEQSKKKAAEVVRLPQR